LISQPTARTLEESMTVGWELLRHLPIAELSRLSDAQIAEHLATITETAGAGQAA
jgi:vacuolar-type H+-ATPase subunit B/Vma2